MASSASSTSAAARIGARQARVIGSFGWLLRSAGQAKSRVHAARSSAADA